MKLAIFIPSLRGGGAEKVALVLANSLSEKGVNIDLVLVKKEGPYLNQLNSKVNIVDLKSSSTFKSLPKLIDYFKKNQPHKVLSIMDYANIVCGLALSLSRIKADYYVSEHSNYSQSFANNISIKNKIISILMPFTYKRAKGIIAVSKGVAVDLEKSLRLKENSVNVIYNPIVSNELIELSNKSLSEIKNYKGKVFVGVGRLTKAKNFQSLIGAFNKVSKEISASLIILGEGELRQELENQITNLELNDKVHLLGFVDNPLQWVKNADVFVSSSSWEGLSNVIIEALACQTNIVATDCPSGPAEILENGKWGLLVPVNDEEALAKAMIKATQTNTEKDDLIKRAFDFSVDKSVNNYYELLGLAK